jgi:hypothetical protein
MESCKEKVLYTFLTYQIHNMTFFCYYKGEVDGFPQIRVVVSLMCPNFPWFVLASKVLQLRINHFVLVLCRSMWVNEACHFFLVPSWNSSTPLYPSIMLWARECALTPCPSAAFSLGLTFESIKELGARQRACQRYNFTSSCYLNIFGIFFMVKELN